MVIRFKLNGNDEVIDVNPLTRLSTILRENFSLLNTKESCLRGQCGACTVLLDNEPVPSCLIPAFSIKSREIITIEFFSKSDNYEIIIKGLKTSGCHLCNYCMQGRILVINHLINRFNELGDSDIYEAMSGNRCECTDFKSLKKGIKLAHLTLERKKRTKNR